MSDPFVGEIRLFAGNVAPVGWAFCDGQLVSRTDHPLLFDQIGTTYGGDSTNFAVPDLRGRVPVHLGPAASLGQVGGAESVSLTIAQLPVHTHALHARDASGDRVAPDRNVWARSESLAFSDQPPDATMNDASLAKTGQGAAHDNMMPFLGVNFIIALDGVPPLLP